MGCDPLEGLACIALDPNTDVAIKVRCFSELAPYVYSKRKPIDTTPESSDLRVNVEFIEPKVSLEGIPIPSEFRTAASNDPDGR
jgi:hypothetical protein